MKQNEYMNWNKSVAMTKNEKKKKNREHTVCVFIYVNILYSHQFWVLAEFFEHVIRSSIIIRHFRMSGNECTWTAPVYFSIHFFPAHKVKNSFILVFSIQQSTTVFFRWRIIGNKTNKTESWDQKKKKNLIHFCSVFDFSTKNRHSAWIYTFNGGMFAF